MDAVVLHSDIARLVLGYLKRQNLERTSRLFCKTSPHLKQEFSAYKKGFIPHSFCPDLEDIICEYVNISCTVDRVVASLPDSLRLQLFESKLSEKVKFLLERALESFLKFDQSENATLKQSDAKHSSLASTSLHSDKENTAKKHIKQKRKRASMVYSPDERKRSATLANKSVKRRRILEPFCYLSAKQLNLKRKRRLVHVTSTADEQTQTDVEIEEESFSEEGNEVEDEDANVQLDNDSDLSLMENPTKESTPIQLSLKGKFLTPSVPELSQAILDNPHFQMKLVDNINQALSNSTNNESQTVLSNINTASDSISTNADTLSEEQQIINSNEMLDQMVKDILKATEKDPAFDAIIENVVGASMQPNIASAGVQCNIDSNPLPQALLSASSLPAMVGQQQQQFTLVHQQQQHQQLAIPCLSAVSNDIPGSTTAPRTPLIIRTAVAAASTSLSSGSCAGESQVISSLATNNTFGSLIDPNFSISKLIVLNPNDSAQKQLPPSDQSIGNTTADHLINQLTSGAEATDETVYFDTNTGQLTIPVFLTDEGLLANFPFLVNNEAVTQQLQSDNICNLDGSRIEIPLPEPIVVSADQLPPNSIIVTSAQKAIAIEEQHLLSEQQVRTVCKKLKEGPTPTSLNVHSNADGETPSTSGITNTKAFKSLSTPRKRTSHVRTLSFSPKIECNSSSSLRRDVLRGGTVLLKSNAEDEEELTNAANVPDKPIIKNVEILQRLDGSVDVSANESSNSCSVPPLFVNEESSNQTIITTELSLKENKGASAMDKSDKSIKSKTEINSNSKINDHPDTPKRKQIRRTAVRACKRRISKPSDDKDKPKSIIQLEENETKEKVSEREHSIEEQRQTKCNEEKMMEEWVRLRNASTSDLDSRLRQLNAENFAAIPKSARRRRGTPQKMRSLRRKKNVISKRMRKKAALAKLEFEQNKQKSLGASDKDDYTKTSNEGDHMTQSEIKVKEKALPLKSGQEKKRASRDKSMEFNIKIPTPQKDKREALMKTKSERSENVTANLTKTSANDAVDNTTIKNSIKRADCNLTTHETKQRLEHERDRRTANIACLLETPFKVPSTLGEVPPTPGIPALSLDTPASKLADVPLSTSYLFGSITKSELETPQLSAITPGFRFTPFGSDVTPRSNAPATDYSSGGSYYKPDESDDLDRKFDKLLRDSAQKLKQEEEENAKNLEQHSNAAEVKNALFEEQRMSPELDMEQKEAAFCVEIPAEKLRVEPIVLKRVKSFGTENTEKNGEGGTAPLNVDPHYTLVSELPEICVEEESSNSSTTFSSSSSSSSDSSSTSSSSSSNSNTASHNADAVENVEEQKKTADNLKLSLDNLSSISSTEDEEWQKLAVTEEENSQLVSNDGEVRYPVRSWLTPSKVDNQSTADAQEQAIATKIKVTVPLKSAEKRNRLEDDLQQKRERMMEKLKKDSNQQREKQLNLPPTTPSGITAALSATRKIAAMREKTKCQPTKASTSVTVSTTSEPKTAKPVVAEKRTVEMLTALELSARKPRQIAADESKTPATAVVMPPLSAVDDNAMSALFSSTPTTTATTNELTEKTERIPLKTFISKVKAKQRQCMQIEALPALKSSRSSCIGRKKIVRKPLGFKGTLAPDVVEEVEQIEQVKSPLKRVAKRADEEDNESERDVSVSPVPKIKIKAPTGTATVTGSKLRVSPRLQGNKNTKAKNNDVDDNKKEVQTKPLKTIKTMRTRTPTAKSLLAACIKVTPVRKRITRGKNATQKGKSKTARWEVAQAQLVEKGTHKEPSVEDMKIDTVQENMHVEETKPRRQEHARKAEVEKFQKKKDADRIKEEKQKQMVKTQKILSKESLAKDVEQHTPTDVVVVKEVTEGNGKAKVKDIKLFKSQIPLPTEISAATEKTQITDQVEKTVAVKNDDMQKLKTRVTKSGESVTDIPKAKPTKSECQRMLKTLTADTAKLNDEQGEEKIESQEKSIEKEDVRKENEQQENELGETTSSTRTETPTSTTNVGAKTTESSEDDPLEGCELTTVTDQDPVRYISVIYDGHDGPPQNPLPRRDFSNFKMVVAFDEDEKHIWRITDELMLFHASPATQQIRNIPKKRKVRINTCGSDQDNIPTVGVVHSTTTTLASTSTTASMTTVSSSRSTNNANAGSREAKAAATSTPTSAPATSSTQESKKLISKVTTTAAAASNKALTIAATTPLSTETKAKSTAGNTEVLQMDDIESLLSHLHGNAN